MQMMKTIGNGDKESPYMSGNIDYISAKLKAISARL